MGVVIHARDEIDDLVGFQGRGPGTDAERRAALHLRGRLAALGRAADVQTIWIRPNWPLAHTMYVVGGIVASIVATAAPLAGAIVAGVVLVAAVTDLGGRVHIGRLLTARRASQNVTSREDGGRPGTLVLVAHYDAARTGYVYGRTAERRASLGRLLHRSIGPFEPIVLALAVVTACAILRAAGVDPLGVAIAQFVATILLIFAAPALVDIVLSDTVPGASDNASGVATVLRLAERYGDDLEHFDVWVLFTGAEEALAEGMREWLRRHRRELDPTSTVFLNVDTVGAGTVRYTRRVGPLLGAALHPRLLALCDRIASEDAERGRYEARRIVMRSIDDSLAARRARFPTISVSCREANDHPANLHRETDTPDRIDDAALERAFRFCSELVELIDERIGPRLEVS
jgi:type IV secretory pathway VirB2 component (pilin)